MSDGGGGDGELRALEGCGGGESARPPDGPAVSAEMAAPTSGRSGA